IGTAESAIRNVGNKVVEGRKLRVLFAESDKEEGDYAPARSKQRGRDFEEKRYPEKSLEPPQQVEALKPVPGTTNAINSILASIPSQQLVEILSQMKFLAQTNPDQATLLLLQNPQLTYALFQANGTSSWVSNATDADADASDADDSSANASNSANTSDTTNVSNTTNAPNTANAGFITANITSDTSDSAAATYDSDGRRRTTEGP
ncbi:hypothetical protein HK096_008434, partial [Nowakowskiella sp. JEL0078]